MSSVIKSGKAPIGSHSLFYKIRGNGSRIVLLTGTNTDTRFKPTVYTVPGIEKFEVLNFDHRGMGQSDSPEGSPTMTDYADDVARLMEFLGWEDAFVLGVSFGGMVAQHFALRYPQMVKKLVLCCTSSGGDGGSSYPLQEFKHFTAEELAAAFVKLMNIQHTDQWQADNPEEARDVYDYYWQSANATLNNPRRREAMDLQVAARAKHDVYDLLKSFTMPALIACGAYDGIATPERSKALCNAIPNAQLKTFEGGHSFLKEDVSAWPAIIEFLMDEEGH